MRKNKENSKYFTRIFHIYKGKVQQDDSVKRFRYIRKYFKRNRCVQIVVLVSVSLIGLTACHLLYTAWNIQSKQVDAAIYNEEAPRVALTFDDGPSSYTMQLSQKLKERDVAATFFLLGENIEDYKEAVKQLAQDGHLLGNHSYHHVQLNKLSDKNACQEIVKTNNMIYEYTGIYPMYIRPPYGEWNDHLDCGVEMIPIFWSVDSLDWKLKSTEKITSRVLKEVEDGDIILMHDGYQTSIEAACQIVDVLKEKGFRFVTADQMVVE